MPSASPAARVLVNRDWQGHYGRGIVNTPSNIGKLGEAPTHPELLDFLAQIFVEDGWSVKKLHRKIVTSDAYKQSSVASALALAKDTVGMVVVVEWPTTSHHDELDGCRICCGNLAHFIWCIDWTRIATANDCLDLESSLVLCM